jgi:hypothetical protein
MVGMEILYYVMCQCITVPMLFPIANPSRLYISRQMFYAKSHIVTSFPAFADLMRNLTRQTALELAGSKVTRPGVQC